MNQQAIVIDRNGKPLSRTSQAKARRLIAQGKAKLVSESPLTVQLNYAVEWSSPQPAPLEPPGQGKRILVHICCAPCATYTVQRLRELAFKVTGYWYNPNIHPFSEHERRRETLVRYAAEISLPVIWADGYDMVDFLRAVNGQETFGVRCALCYQMRLDRVAQVAAEHQFDAWTTTLFISPYQNQTQIRTLGQTSAERYGVDLFFENFRRGWAEHHQLVRKHRLYSQRYCGCVYSEWEALDRTATTHTRRSS